MIECFQTNSSVQMERGNLQSTGWKTWRTWMWSNLYMCRVATTRLWDTNRLWIGRMLGIYILFFPKQAITILPTHVSLLNNLHPMVNEAAKPIKRCWNVMSGHKTSAAPSKYEDDSVSLETWDSTSSSEVKPIINLLLLMVFIEACRIPSSVGRGMIVFWFCCCSK